MRNMIEDAKKVGKLLFDAELIDGASGNMSFKDEKVYVTKTGCVLFDLRDEDFVEVDSKFASRDRLIHKKIYEKSSHRCVIHCHGVYNVVLSMVEKEIKPVDLEGKLYFGSIEVVEGEFGSEELADKIASVLAKNKVVFVRGHGMYVGAENFIEAFNLSCYAEHSCKVLFNLKLLNELHHRERWENL